MIIGDRLRALREEKKLSQGDIEKAYGPASLLYLPRLKNGHTVPAIENAREKWPELLKVPIVTSFFL